LTLSIRFGTLRALRTLGPLRPIRPSLFLFGLHKEPVKRGNYIESRNETNGNCNGKYPMFPPKIPQAPLDPFRQRTFVMFTHYSFRTLGLLRRFGSSISPTTCQKCGNIILLKKIFLPHFISPSWIYTSRWSCGGLLRKAFLP